MFLYDTRLLPPSSEEEACRRFSEVWALATKYVEARPEAQRFLKRWSKLSQNAKDMISHAVQVEWGDDLDIGEMLSKATFGWDGYDNYALFAQALIPLILWYEADGSTAKAWRHEAGDSKFIGFVIKNMKAHKDARQYATSSCVETMMKHLGH